MMLQRRTICALWALTVCIAFLADVHADEPSYLRGPELTSQLDIEASSLRKSIRDGEFTFDISVTNQSNRDYRGPLALVIEKTGVESLLPKKFDHQFADDGQGFLALVKNNQTLKSGETLKLRRVRLKSTKDLKTDPANQFSLVARVYELKTAEQNVADRGESSEKTVQGHGLPGGIPMKRPEPAAGQDSADDPERGLKPVPDPIGDRGEAPPVPTLPVADNPAQNGENNLATKGKPRRFPTEEELEAALEAQDEWTEKLFDIEGVHAIGASRGDEGEAVILVQVQKFDQKKAVPGAIDGVAVKVLVTEQIKVLDRRGQIGYFNPNLDCVDNPTRFFARPTPIGVSGWNTQILICATGTLGARLESDLFPDQKFILSNSHVLADFGIGLSGTGFPRVGDEVIQPGLLDFSCTFPPDGVVGTLHDFSSYIFDDSIGNFIDAAIAETTPLFFGNSTPCNGYGVPSEVSVPAFLGQEVMKYGRTTEFTVGEVFLLNGTIDVLTDELTGTTARFFGQIGIIPDRRFLGQFSDGGDSGSLIVSRDGRNPVGLLFAGSPFFTFANPIDTVLNFMSFDVPGDLRVDGEPAFAP